MLKAGSERSTSSYNTVISTMLNTGGEVDTIRYNMVIKASVRMKHWRPNQWTSVAPCCDVRSGGA